MPAHDFLYVDERASTRHAIVHNALVAYRSPDDGSSVVIKRVVGVPGDTLRMRNDSLIRNDRIIEEPFVTISLTLGDSLNEMGNWGPVTVSDDSMFVLGDNRHASKDSRHVGLIPIANVLGKPRLIYYSYDPEAEARLPFLTAVRWKRIGMMPQ